MVQIIVQNARKEQPVVIWPDPNVKPIEIYCLQVGLGSSGDCVKCI